MNLIIAILNITMPLLKNILLFRCSITQKTYTTPLIHTHAHAHTHTHTHTPWCCPTLCIYTYTCNHTHNRHVHVCTHTCIAHCTLHSQDASHMQQHSGHTLYTPTLTGIQPQTESTKVMQRASRGSASEAAEDSS